MIEIRSLTFGYGKKKALFQDFSFYLEPGCVCGLLGKNGVGKSTLLYLLCGLLQPRQGEVMFRGFNTFKRMPVQTKEMFFIPEDFELPKLPLSRFVQANAGFYPRFSREALSRNLEIFEMDLDQDLGALSMGQKKKVYMCFAMATGARLLLMDEPTNGLDIPGKSQFRKMIAENMDDNRSILISTHQVNDIDKMLDRVVILDETGIQLDETVGALFDTFLFLETGHPDAFPDWIYSQPSVGGVGLIVPNSTGEEGSLNLELLFNGVCTERNRMKEILNRKKKERARV